ncbi:uncharacterized protein [Apostichopus japonicus]|uniref:uncharacterized protein n=1 Tax=Stichopus japonicus TaxID=307972 RepID=UPI003AB19D90
MAASVVADPGRKCILCAATKTPLESDINRLPTIKLSECVVEVAGKYVSFDQATRGYIDEHFPNLETDTYKVPSAFVYQQDERLDYVVDEQVPKLPKGVQRSLKGHKSPEEILSDRIQKEAVEKIARAIDLWGKRNKEPMLVLSEFKFTSFLNHVKKKKKKEDTKYEALERKEICDVNGEHDIAVINMKLGVIFFQVKSVSESSERTTQHTQLKRALKQVVKDIHAMKTMNRDLLFVESLPMLEFIAVPNLSNGCLIDVCAEHDSIILRSDQIANDDSFSKWWMSNVQESLQKEDYAMTTSQYKDLFGRYIGPASSVKYRTLSDAISKMGSKVGKLKLTEEQKEILTKAPSLNILLGDFGTGKSLLLIKKAKSLASSGIVYIISFAAVSDGTGKVQEEEDNCVDFLKDMLSKDGTRAENEIHITSFLKHIKVIESRESITFPELPFQLTPDFLCAVIRITVQRHPTHTVHFLLDELPLCIGKCKGGWNQLEAFLKDNTSMTVWMTISCCSYALKKGEEFSCLYEHLPGSFKKSILTQCMRTSRNGFKLVQAVRKFKGDGLFSITKPGNAIDGPIPIWYELTTCECPRTEDPLSLYCCRCVGVHRLKNILCSIMSGEVHGINLNDVAIILHDTYNKMTQFLARAVEEACDSLSIDVNYKVSSVAKRSEGLGTANAEDGSKGAVTLVDFWSYKGNEKKAVVYIDPYGGPLVWNITSRWHGYQDVAGTLSRALAQIFYVTWPKEEQDVFLLDLAEILHKTAPTSADPLGINFKVGIARGIRNGRRGHKWEHRKFMDYLVEENVITRYEVLPSSI